MRSEEEKRLAHLETCRRYRERKAAAETPEQREERLAKARQSSREYYAENRGYWSDRYTENKAEILHRTSQWARKNKEQRNEISQRWRDTHPEAAANSWKDYASRNPEKRRESVKRSRQKHTDRVVHANALRRAAKLSATPRWADMKQIQSMYAFAAWLNQVTFGAIGYHVDHIVPLKHPLVCGLHCQANLQILRAAENLSKGNKFEV